MAEMLADRLLEAARRALVHTLAELCAAVGAAESSILLPRGEAALAFFASTNPALMRADAPAVPINASFSGLAYRTGQTIAFADAANQPPHFKAVDELVGAATREFAAVPFIDGATGGVLTLVNRAAGAAAPFTLVELRQAEALARGMARPLALLAELAAPDGAGARANATDPALLADIALLTDAERRVVQSLVGALLQNRVD